MPSSNTVLIVDDDQDIRESIEELLRSDGLTSVTAANGEEALQVLSEQSVGIILLDLMMPVMNGQQLVAELRLRSINVPVVLLSAGRDLRRVATELKLPAIEKPFDLDILLGEIRKILQSPPEDDLEVG